MHGRPRPPKDFRPPPEAVAAQQRKTKLLQNATSEVLKRRREKDYSEESLALAARLLSLNPEVYTVWNFRREALTQIFGEESRSVEEKRAVSEKELQVSAEALKRNPKSYSAWHQRQWVVTRGYCVPRHEFMFVEARLDEDERNFHAWNYRRFLANFAGRTPQEELAYSRKKIEQNFSNFSAWHYRTKYLPLVGTNGTSVTTLADLLNDGEKAKSVGKSVTPEQGSVCPSVLEEEYDVVHSAFATDSEDSSAWFYYRWLLGHSVKNWLGLGAPSKESTSVDTIMGILDREKSRMEDYLEMDPDAKWPLLASTWLDEIKNHCQPKHDEAMKANSGDTFSKLMSLDRQRKGFYCNARDGETSVVISARLRLQL